MPSDADSIPPLHTKLDERHLILRHLGRGGFGDVFLVQDTLRAGPLLALKTVRRALAGDREFERRFNDEIRILRSLRHRCIPAIHNDGRTSDGTHFFTMDYVEGRTLETVLQERGTLPPARIARIVSQIVDVLEHAHVRGVVHRDLKPGNVMLIQRGARREDVRVLDFGIARIVHSDSIPMYGTAAPERGPLGTPDYMSPEQILGYSSDSTDGSRNPDAARFHAASDYYSLGILLYRMTSGRFPFRGNSVEERAYARLHREPIPLPRGLAPPSLARLIAALLARDPAARPRGSEVRAALERARREVDPFRPRPTAPRFGPGEKPLRIEGRAPISAGPRRRRRASATVAMIGLVCLGAALWQTSWWTELGFPRSVYGEDLTPEVRGAFGAPASSTAAAERESALPASEPETPGEALDPVHPASSPLPTLDTALEQQFAVLRETLRHAIESFEDAPEREALERIRALAPSGFGIPPGEPEFRRGLVAWAERGDPLAEDPARIQAWILAAQAELLDLDPAREALRELGVRAEHWSAAAHKLLTLRPAEAREVLEPLDAAFRAACEGRFTQARSEFQACTERLGALLLELKPLRDSIGQVIDLVEGNKRGVLRFLSELRATRDLTARFERLERETELSSRPLETQDAWRALFLDLAAFPGSTEPPSGMQVALALDGALPLSLTYVGARPSPGLDPTPIPVPMGDGKRVAVTLSEGFFVASLPVTYGVASVVLKGSVGRPRDPIRLTRSKALELCRDLTERYLPREYRFELPSLAQLHLAHTRVALEMPPGRAQEWCRDQAQHRADLRRHYEGSSVDPLGRAGRSGIVRAAPGGEPRESSPFDEHYVRLIVVRNR